MTGFFDRVVPEQMLRVVDSWRFWITLSFFALAAISVWLAVVTMRTAQTASHQAREQAVRQAAIDGDYKACVRSIPNVARVNRFLGGVNDLATILVQNSQATLDSFPASDPQQPTRRKNLARIRMARAKIGAIRSFPVPTVRSCARVRDNARSRG